MFKKILLAVAALLILPLTLAYFGFIELGFMKTFGVKRENVRRHIFKETRSYNEGKIQDLARYYMQYSKASPEEKEIIASTVRHMYADYNCEEMPYSLKVFLKEVRGY